MSDQGPSNYGGWSVAHLKEELATRGASLRGKKKELVERLEAYDRNANFGNAAGDVEEEEQLMPWTQLPMTHPTSAFQCPPVNNDCIYDYFAGEGAKVHPSAHMMYREGSVASFLCAQDGCRTFLRCSVKSEMTKRMRYCVLLVVLSTGAVEAANCECTAGSGAKATCKHVAVILYGLECLARTGKINVEKTCTDVAQAWHQPKKAAAGSPLKASSIVYKSKKGMSTGSGENSRAEANVVEGEHDRIMNLIYNFQATQDKPLIMSLSTGLLVNVPAYTNDHDYLEAPLGVAIAHNKTKVSGQEASQLEEATRQQATSAKWIRERQVRLTASRFGEVMCMRPSTNGSRLARDIANPRSLNVPAVRWGKEMEALILRQYEVETDVTVARSGLVVDKERPYLACSPDGVLPDRVVEMKGIFSRKGEMICAESADWLECDAAGCLQLKAGSKHWYQVQGQMAIVGRELCDLVVFTDIDVRVIKVAMEPNFYVQTMVPRLRAFYDGYIVPEIMKNLRR